MPEDRGSEFWQEERNQDRAEMRGLTIRWGLLFVAVLAGFGLLLWRSQSAVEYAASRTAGGDTPARYRVFGTALSAVTGTPVPWPYVADEVSGRTPAFQASGNRDGAFSLMTLAEPHDVIISAYGFRPAKVRVGRAWYLWMPAGEEKIDVRLSPEADTGQN